MANRVPFTAYFKIVPDRGTGKRFEIQRSREHLAHLIYLDLTDAANPTRDFTDGNITSPGGGGNWGLSTEALSDMVPTVAVKPQFGESPDMVTVTGFYNGSAAAPYSQKGIICGGKYVVGPASGAPGYSDNTMPSSTNLADATALAAGLIGAIVSVEVELIKLEVAGVSYGRGHLHIL